MVRHLFIISVIVVFCFSCGTDRNNIIEKKRIEGQELEALNRYMVGKDKERIENFIERKGYEMEENSLGLWSEIIETGEGDYIKDNDKVIFEYECSLLDGTVCYTSEELGNKEFVLGKSEMEAGLDVALRMLKKGGEGLFIMPPFLGYGIKGDGKNIPSRSILVYYIKVIDLN